MEFPDDILRLIKEFSMPLTRCDYKKGCYIARFGTIPRFRYFKYELDVFKINVLYLDDWNLPIMSFRKWYYNHKQDRIYKKESITPFDNSDDEGL